MDLISIIIPVYNSEKYIEKCILSILNQDYKNIEVIAVDDGSSDNSLDVLNRLAKNDARIKIYSKENGGVSSARNLAIEKANGAFISFVDSDDYLPENVISTLYSYVSDDVDLISGSYVNIKLKKEYLRHNSQTIYPAQKYTSFLEYEHTNWGPCGKLYRKSIIDENNILFPIGVHYGEDHIFNLKYTKYAKNSFVITDKVVYCYNNRLRDNLCSRAFKDMANAEKALFEAVLDFFENESISAETYNTYLLGTLNGCLEHYCVYFKGKQRTSLIKNAFEVYSKYITEDFLKNAFSDVQIDNIKSNDFVSFEKQYIKDNKQIAKRTIKKHIKNIIKKFIK